MMARLAGLLRARGAATSVEFALVAIPLLFFVLGIMELGRVFQYQTTLQHAVGVAARYGSIYTQDPDNPRPTADEIQAEALARSSTIAVDADVFTVTIDDVTEHQVVVSASYTYTFLFVGFLPWNSVTLGASATANRYID